MTEQKLPAVEAGHVSDQRLPRVEGQGVQDDVPHSEYPKWFQHRGTGAILVQSAEEEAMRQAESDALPPPAEPTENDLAKAELEKELGRPLTDLECMIGPASLLAYKRDKNTLLVFHPDRLRENMAMSRMDDDGGAIAAAPTEFTTAPDHLDAPPVVIERTTLTAPLPDFSSEGDTAAYPSPPSSAE